MPAPWLAIDVGSGSAKAALFEDGELLQSASAAYETRYATGGIAEQDANDWWGAVKQVCRALKGAGELAGIALTGQMQDVVLLDGDGAPIRPVILYSDTRATAQIEAIHQRVSPAELAAITGLEQSAGSLLAKLSWLREHEPERLREAAHLLLGGADFIAARMTGRFHSDATTASTTGLWNLAAHRPLDAALLERMQLGWLPSLMTPVLRGGANVGCLTATAAKALGLRPGAPVYLAPGDAGAATIGAGCGEPGPAYAYVGTSGWVGFSARIIGDASAGVLTLAHPKPGRFIQVAPMMTSAGNIDWLQSVFNPFSHDQLINEALSRPPSNLIFLPYLHGERAPFDDPFARGAFIGVAANTERADLWRALLEGIVFAYRHTLSALSPALPDQLTLIGGGARNAAWNQLFADIIGTPVHLPPEAEFAGLRGALRSVEVTLGARESYAIPPSSQTIILSPDPLHRHHYDRKYQHFLAAYQALKPLFQQMARAD